MLKGFHFVLIEDDAIMGNSLVQRLELEGADVLWVKQATRGIAAVRTPRKTVDAVICDIQLPDGTGEEVYSTLVKTATPPPFLFITGHGGVDQAVRLLKAGAADYITKPFEMAQFLERLALLVSRHEADVRMPPILGVSAEARRVEQQMKALADLDDPLMIRGGAGVGKRAVAERIHALSNRRAAPFIAVNLGRATDLQAELFAPDGALARIGEGTLFLQSIQALPQDAQPRLLARLDSGFAGRLVAACDPGFQPDAARFNPDLYYMLCAHEIAIPPLSDRREDAVWLLGRIFEQANARRAVPLKGISDLTLAAVRGHDWPGGGRELRARVIAGVERAAGAVLQPVDIFPEAQLAEAPVRSLAEAREEAERQEILRAIAATDGQIGRAAALLRVSRTTLWERMQRLGISQNQG